MHILTLKSCVHFYYNKNLYMWLSHTWQLFTAHEGALRGGTEVDGFPCLLTFIATIPESIFCSLAVRLSRTAMKSLSSTDNNNYTIKKMM